MSTSDINSGLPFIQDINPGAVPKMEAMIIQKPIVGNGGYGSPAASCKELVISKEGVTLRLDGSELARLYNLIKPEGTAPHMDDPNEN